MTMFRGAAAALLTMAVSFSAWADAFDDGTTAYRAGEYEKALALLMPLAEGGHIQAQLFVGGMYKDGKGVAEDAAVAYSWYRRAADKNSPSGQKEAADFLYLGKGVAKDLVAAADLYGKAARQGSPDAQFMLGHMYHYGFGLPKDASEAVRWYSTAADQGYVISEVLDFFKK